MSIANKYSDELTISTKHFVWLHHLVWEAEQQISYADLLGKNCRYRHFVRNQSQKLFDVHSWYGRPLDTSQQKNSTCLISAHISKNFFKTCELMMLTDEFSKMKDLGSEIEILISGIFLKYKVDRVRILDSNFFVELNPIFKKFLTTQILFPKISGLFTDWELQPVLEIESSEWWKHAGAQDHRIQLSYLTKRDVSEAPKKEKGRFLIRLFSFNRRQ